MGSRIDKLLAYIKENKGSDLHISCGVPPKMRASGELEDVRGAPALSEDLVMSLLQEVLHQERWSEFTSSGDLDFAYEVSNVARFRVNYSFDNKGASAVFRIIPTEIPALSSLGLPSSVENLAHLDHGLVLVTGPTGSGKSTTLAGLIDTINSTYSRHIVTIEDPIEFVHTPKRCVITQREVGVHTDDFSAGLKAAMRLDPDVILVGEMRDRITIQMALTAAEMGSLVFATLHTNSAAKTIDRIVDAFPVDQQGQTRSMLAESLAAVVSQILVPRSDRPGRVVAVEVLMANAAVANAVREGRSTKIVSIIQTGKKSGMQAMDECLLEHVGNGLISPEDAFLKATDRSLFEKWVHH